ncbi:hypothetical protein C8F01DRAFT_1371746 [Mycena amicta]|nr:hypothetical protein C8F01DRAFT_1371746 [Mycena amicta]
MTSNCPRCSFSPSALLPSVAETESLRVCLRSSPPSEQDASYLRFRAVVDTGHAELARYDTRIQELQTQLNVVYTERDSLEKHIDSCRSLFESPIRAQPTEILARILELDALSAEEPLSSRDTRVQEVKRFGKSNLLKLATVCWRWREIVMGTPGLWARIYAKPSLWPSSERQRDHYFARLLSILARSGSFPLALEVSAYAAGSSMTSSILFRLAEHASRWETVVFWLDAEAFVSMAAAAGQFAQLRRLELYTRTFDDFPAPSNLFAVAPLLRCVLFAGKPRNIPSLPWSQITDFTYSSMQNPFTPADCRTLPLNELPRGSAVQLDVLVSTTFDDDVDSPQRTRESLLGSLNLQFVAKDTWDDKKAALGCILDTLTLPALTTFSLKPRSRVVEFPVWNPYKFAQLSERSGFGARLSSLTIIALISDVELLDTLTSLPNLVDLVITDLPLKHHILVTDNLLRALIIPSFPDSKEPTSSAILVPRLGLLQLSSSLHFADDLLLSVVESRVVHCAETLGDELDYFFTLDLRWMKAAERELGEEFLIRLQELKREERFGLLLGAVGDSAWHAKWCLV